MDDVTHFHAATRLNIIKYQLLSSQIHLLNGDNRDERYVDRIFLHSLYVQYDEGKQVKFH